MHKLLTTKTLSTSLFLQKALFFITQQRQQPSLRLPSFSHFPLHQGITKYLQSSQIHTPTYIQYALLSSLQDNYNTPHHITSPTGSGKTMAYLLPIINHLKQQQTQQGVILTQSLRPRALVLTLNKQLALQTRNVAKSFSHFSKLKCEGLNLGKSMNEQAKIIQNGVDVLVSTYKRLLGFIERKQLFLSNLEWIVVDEADTFMQIGSLGSILNNLKPLYTPTQQKPFHSRILLSGTTNPPVLQTFVKQHFGHKNYIDIKDKNSHINLQNIKHEFVQAFDKDKHQLLRSLLVRQRQGKTIIFCNTVNSLVQLQHFCQTQGIKVATLHSQLAKKMRRVNYQRFRDNQQNILLSTDLGARGLDFPGLERVINYDFPLSTTDYLQRVGRTGRAGNKGLAITLYRKHDINVIEELKGSGFDKPIKISNSAYGLKNRQDNGRSKWERK